MKPRTVMLIALLLIAAAYLANSDRRLALLARFRKATDGGERHTLDEIDALFGVGDER